MEISTIIDRLADAEDLPEDAIRAAREQRAAAAPAFVDLVERYLAGEPDAEEREGAQFYIFHLLGEWREKTAYRPLARLLAFDADEVDGLLGDATASTAHRVMAAVFDGDSRPLYEVIEAEHADPFVRSRMLEALAMLVLRGELERDEVARYLRDAFSSLKPQSTHFVWFGWQSAIAALGLAELSSLVEKAFARRLIDPMDMRFADYESDLEHALAHSESPWRVAAPNEFAPLDDTIGELSSLYAFSADATKTRTIGRRHSGRPSRRSIPSRASAATTLVPAAAARSSRGAARRSMAAQLSRPTLIATPERRAAPRVSFGWRMQAPQSRPSPPAEVASARDSG